MEIIFEQCPSCMTHACAFAVIDGKTVCPMCAPVPERKPHDFRPLTGCDPRLALETARKNLKAGL